MSTAIAGEEEPREEQRPAGTSLCLDAQTVLSIAQALQHVNDLEELSTTRITTGKEDGSTGTITLRTGLAILRRIMSPRRMIVLADKASETPSWWKANRLAYYTTMRPKEIARWCGISERTCRKYITEPEIGDDVYEALPPEDPFD